MLSFPNKIAFVPFVQEFSHVTYVAVMVNFMWQLDWATGCPDIWFKHYSGCIYEDFLDEINIWISRLNKADCPLQRGWASSNPLKACIEQKAWVRENLFSLHVFELGHQSPPAFGFRLRLEFTPSALLGLQLAYCRSWEFSASIITQANSLSYIYTHTHTHIHTYTSYWFCFSKEPWLSPRDTSVLSWALEYTTLT